MPAEQLRRRQVQQAALVLIDQPPVLDIDVPVLAGHVQRRAHPLRLLLDHGHAPRRSVRREITGTPRLMMPAFSPAIVVERVAEKFGVIDR